MSGPISPFFHGCNSSTSARTFDDNSSQRFLTRLSILWTRTFLIFIDVPIIKGYIAIRRLQLDILHPIKFPPHAARSRSSKRGLGPFFLIIFPYSELMITRYLTIYVIT